MFFCNFVLWRHDKQKSTGVYLKKVQGSYRKETMKKIYVRYLSLNEAWSSGTLQVAFFCMLCYQSDPLVIVRASQNWGVLIHVAVCWPRADVLHSSNHSQMGSKQVYPSSFTGWGFEFLLVSRLPAFWCLTASWLGILKINYSLPFLTSSVQLGKVLNINCWMWKFFGFSIFLKKSIFL